MIIRHGSVYLKGMSKWKSPPSTLPNRKKISGVFFRNRQRRRIFSHAILFSWTLKFRAGLWGRNILLLAKENQKSKIKFNLLSRKGCKIEKLSTSNIFLTRKFVHHSIANNFLLKDFQIKYYFFTIALFSRKKRQNLGDEHWPYIIIHIDENCLT
jgi:hypothetical protein